MTSKVPYHPPADTQTRRETEATELQDIPFIPTVILDLNAEIPREESLMWGKVTRKAGANELGKSLYSW